MDGMMDRSKLPVGIIVITVVLSAIIFGGGVYLYSSSKFEQDQQALKNQIDKLAEEKEALDARIDNLEKPTVQSQSGVGTIETTKQDTQNTTTKIDESANWKTYSSTTYGFSFKHPMDWEVRDLTSGVAHEKEYVAFFGAAPKTVKGDTFWNVGVLSTSLDQEVERQTKIINSNDYSELISVTAVQKFGLSGKKLSQKNKTTGAIYSTYYFEKNGYTYSIPSDSTDNDGNTQMGYRITETFSFSR